MTIIETHGLTKHYSRGKIRALEDLSISVEAGRIFSLLGPNGAGKTTLIKLLLGIVFPTRGSATVLGRDISDPRAHSRLGYLAENHRFPEFLTARQTLYYYGKMSGVAPQTLKKRIPGLLALVNLSKWEQVKIRKFSKGMLQRVGIAQALCNDPELLFLDEPTDGIDPVGRREIRDILQRLRDQGKTIFLNSHLLSEVERISDEVAILKNGRLIRQGRVEEFISIKEQYQVQVAESGTQVAEICRELNIPMIPQNGNVLISVGDEEQLNRFIDRLRQEGVLIRAITPRKISLEDFFIDVIEETAEGSP